MLSALFTSKIHQMQEYEKLHACMQKLPCQDLLIEYFILKHRLDIHWTIGLQNSSILDLYPNSRKVIDHNQVVYQKLRGSCTCDTVKEINGMIRFMLTM